MKSGSGRDQGKQMTEREVSRSEFQGKQNRAGWQAEDNLAQCVEILWLIWRAGTGVAFEVSGCR